MKKVYVILICLMCLLLVGTTVIAKNVSDNIISENDIQENTLADNTVNEENENIVEDENVIIEDFTNNIEETVTENEIELENLVGDGKDNIKEGTYRIASALNPLIGLDIKSGSTASKANVHVYNYTGVKQAQFKLEYLGEGYYKIINVKSGKVLDVANNGKTSGTNVWQYDDNGTDAQKWKFQKTSDGYYNIVSKSSGLVLDIANAKIECGSNVQVYKSNGTNAQKFQLLGTEMIKSEKIFDEGTYRISAAIKTASNVDVKSGSTANKANIHLWTYAGKEQQKFKLEYSDGYYVIRNLKSNKVLDVDNNGKSSGTNVQQYTYNGTDAQKWIIQKTSDGYYNIISKSSGLFLDISNASTSDGANIQIYTANGTKSQKFNFIFKGETKGKKTLEEGTYRIVTAKNQNVGLDVSSANKNDGGNVQLWKWDNVNQQKFNLVYNGDGYYTIIAVHSGKVLDVANSGNTNKTNVQQYTNNGTDAQKWVIKDIGNDTYNIISKKDSMYLDFDDGKTENGTNVKIYEPDGKDAQKFKFIKISDQSEITINDGNYRIAYGSNNNYGLDVAGGSKDNKANVQLWKWDNVEQQRFEIKYTDKFYKIKCIKSEKYLEVDSNNNNVYQNEENSSDAQKWTIRRTSDGHYTLISKLNGYCLDLHDAKVANGTNIQVYKGNNTNAQKFDFLKIGVTLNIDDNKYPGIKETIEKLSEAHPNWEFEILYTTLDFDTAVQAEYEYDNKKANLVYTPTYKGDWIASNPYVEGNWASASFNAIAYFMDPRNFLNDVDIFQFVDLANYELSGATLESIQFQIDDTYLDGYAKDIQNACKAQDINPYYVLARLIQEQGENGSLTINMDGGDGKRYFNPFNIDVPHGSNAEMKAAALKKAKEEGWDTMQKGLEAGIEFLKDGYIDANQNTLYLNKFDVNPNSPGKFYTHQYMQNLSAAYSEARIFRGSYEDSGTVDNAIKFLIPVYENMPEEPYDKPTGKGENPITSKGPLTVQVYDITSTLRVREGPGEKYDTLPKSEWLKNGTILISIERSSNGWYRLLLPSGKEGYASGEYLKVVDDLTNCNEKVKVDTQSNIGANVRIGPGTSYSKIKAVSEGATGIRILKNQYKADGETWDIVIFDDGTKGFVAASSLKVI